ncbi:hypothetical protein [Sutcliffiella horikoshii]|uniref:WYL domain-containing protein n=1 Tax=Sutcliffiella horikoshii TaxID=79883 RepID=A0A5D4TCY4_9BACI|nr:hypothetical protein [Sutcliffiella horikoshii]TYS73620.1 hypothetical protein FZC75_04625 [Sutcliffiella horikoshii]
MSRTLEWYMNSRTPIEIIYMSKDGSITQRSLLVLDINKNNVTAFCYLRNQKRTFLLENILSYRPLIKTYKNEVI